MTLKEIRKVISKLDKLERAHDRLGDEWHHDPYIRDILRDKLKEERQWIVTLINGEVIEVEV